MKPVTEADIGPGGEAEWQRLRRQLELAEGFWLGFIFSPSPLTSGVLRRRTELLLRGQTRRLESFYPESPAALRGLLPSLFTPEVASAGCTWLEALHLDPADGAERPWRDAWLELVSRMNERRDALRRHLRGGLILVAPVEMKLPIREAASDLWSIRASVIDLASIVDGLPRESHLRAEFSSERVVSGKGIEVEALAEFALAESARLLGKANGNDSRKMEVLFLRVNALLSSGRTGEAVETARLARELALRDSRGASHLQATALHKLALAEKAHGDPVAAAEHLEQAVKVLGNRDNRYRLLLLEELADIALGRGDLVSALAAYEESVALDRQLRAALGDVPETLRNLSVSLNNRGDVQLRLGQFPAASAAFAEALVLRRQLRAALGDTPMVLRDLSVSLDRVGNVQHSLGHFPAASAAFEESLKLRRQLRTILGDTPEVLRDLAVSLDKSGHLEQSLGHFPAASAAFEESLVLTRQIHIALGDTPEALRDVSASLDRIGDLEQSLGHLPAASAAFEESLALRRKLRTAVGDTPEILRDLAVSLNNVGDVQLRADRLTAASAAFEESLGITRQLRAVLGDTPESLRALGVSLDRVGRVQRLLGHLQTASAALEETLAIARELHLLMGDIPQCLKDLAVSLKNVAHIREELGDSDGAELAREESQAVYSRLKK